MAQIPDKVLAWLYSVLHEYHDQRRTYSDAVNTLSAYPSLSPRTEVYTYEDGSSALLLTLSGTLPVSFRGITYRFPVAVWLPQRYPQEAPMAFVTPGRDMVIRPGQHVGVDGRIYHPYLRDWGRMYDRATMKEFLEFLQQVFAKEPPVISKAQQQQYQRPIRRSPPPAQAGPSTAAPPPPPPPKQRVESTAPIEVSSTDAPPPRPPKSGEETSDAYPTRSSSRNVERDGPPLPPLPHERPRPSPAPGSQCYQSTNGTPPQQQPQDMFPHTVGYQAGRPPDQRLSLPGQPPPRDSMHQQQRSAYNRSPVSPVSPVNGYSERRGSTYSYPSPQPPPPHFGPSGPTHRGGLQNDSRQPQYQQANHPMAPPLPEQYRAHQAPRQQQLPLQQPQQPKRQPPPDLLSDPFDIALPNNQTSNPAPAPPIPPNPEREHLLAALSTTLTHQATTKIHQNLSALPSLRAQNHALSTAHAALQSEIHHLTHLDRVLATNEQILYAALRACDDTISTAKSKPPPPIDEVLIAPTLVANQLWTLCAEEAACREAMYVLQKAVDRGRVGAGDFVKQMRGLGREGFLKMVLARKCARGLGLEVGGRRV